MFQCFILHLSYCLVFNKIIFFVLSEQQRAIGIWTEYRKAAAEDAVIILKNRDDKELIFRIPANAMVKDLSSIKVSRNKVR